LSSLERVHRGGRRALWILPAVFRLWVHTHGSFVFGLLALGAYWAAGLVDLHVGSLAAERSAPEHRRQIAVITFLCVLALNVTPYASRLAANPLLMASSQPVNIASVQEWQPMP